MFSIMKHGIAVPYVNHMSIIPTEKLQVQLGPRHHVFLIHQPHRCRSFNEDSGHLRSVTQPWPVTSRDVSVWLMFFWHAPAWDCLFHITQHGWSLGMAYCCGFPSFLGINPVEKEVSHLFPWFDYDFVLTCLLDHEPGIVLKCLSKHFEIHTSWLVLDNLSAESVLAGYHPFPLARWGWIDKWRRHARKHKESDKCKSSVTHIHNWVTGAYRIVSACK
jgi:hypothetical protein